MGFFRKQGAKSFQNVHIANERKNSPAKLLTTIPMMEPKERELELDGLEEDAVSVLVDVAVTVGIVRPLREVV
jgi:hypothetical protein